MRQIGTVLTLLVMWLCLPLKIAAAQDLKDLKLQSVITPQLALGTDAVVQIDGGLPAVLAAGKAKLSDFILYLDGHPVATGADGPSSDIPHSKLAFLLQRTDTNTSAWRALLGSPTALKRSVQVDVGIAGQTGVLPTASSQPLQATLIVIRTWGLIVGFVFLFLVICGVVILACVSDLLRDSQPADFGDFKDANDNAWRRPFSLAQTQMAWWFALVIAAFIFIYFLTGDFNSLTAQALTLMGIGTGTALGAVMVEKTSNKNSAQQEFTNLLSKIKQAKDAGTAPVAADLARGKELASRLASKNFIDDTLTDVDGVSLHRFQIMAWTLVVGVIFCIEVYRNLALPTFDATILGILGISAGTYLGFKIPEQPN